MKNKNKNTTDAKVTSKPNTSQRISSKDGNHRLNIYGRAAIANTFINDLNVRMWGEWCKKTNEVNRHSHCTVPKEFCGEQHPRNII